MNKKEKFFGVNKTNWGHKWGFSDSGFIVNNDKSVSFTGDRYPICGKRLPNFIPFIEKELGIEFQSSPKIKEIKKKHVNPHNLNQAFMDDLNLLIH